MTEPESIPNPPEGGQPESSQPGSGWSADGTPEIDPLDVSPAEDSPVDVSPVDVSPVAVGPLEAGLDIGWPDTEAETATRAQLLTIGAAGRGRRAGTEPASDGLPLGLGRLGDLAIWLSGVQGVSPPHEPRRPRLIVFGGPAVEGVEPGQADLAAVFAGVADVGVRVVSLERAPDTHAADTPAPDTHAPDTHAPDTDARAATRIAIETGIRIADEEIDAGADLLAVGALGSGSATAAAVVVSVMTLVEPIKVVGPSSPLGDQAWMRQVAEIRDTRLRAIPHRHDVEALLATVGGADLAAITAFLIRAAIRRTPVILDGTIVGAAALLAREVSPNAVRWWQPGERGTDPANLLAMEEFRAVPLLDLGLEVGDGVGAVLAVPLVRAAARAANDLTAVDASEAEPVAANGG